MEQPTTASEIRELYNNTLSETENYNRQLGEKVQIVDMGDTQKKIEESFQLISQLTRVGLEPKTLNVVLAGINVGQSQ